MESGEKRMNPVPVTIVNPWKEYWPSRGSNQQPTVPKSRMTPTEIWASTGKELKKKQNLCASSMYEEHKNCIKLQLDDQSRSLTFKEMIID